MAISVLQWNIWFNEDIHNTVAFLKANPADIICLQELILGAPHQTVVDTPAFVAAELGYNYYCKELPIMSPDAGRVLIANAIFSRFPIVESRFVWTNEPEGEGGYDNEYRAYVEVLLKVGKKKLRVGTTHMSYTHQFVPTSNKRRETRRLVAELRKSGEPLLLTGDLNATPASYTVEAISKVLQNAGPDILEPTWTTKPFSYNGFTETELMWRLDYIFASKDIKVRSAQVLPTEFSDHLPILASISLP